MRQYQPNNLCQDFSVVLVSPPEKKFRNCYSSSKSTTRDTIVLFFVFFTGLLLMTVFRRSFSKFFIGDEVAFSVCEGAEPDVCMV